jgi:ribonuclease HI
MSDLEESVSRPEVRKRANTTTLRWTPPPQGVAKINVDAALSKNTSTASTAAVARDAVGNFLGASSVVIHGITDPETMEVLAFREGLALANDLSLHQVRMASDCANAVRSLAHDTLGVYSHIVKEIKADAAAFQRMEFVHEKREANHDAHVLARSTLFSSIGRHVWFFDPLDGVCNSYSVT